MHPNPEPDKKFQRKLNKRVLDLREESGFNSSNEARIEFFFYSHDENNAANLSVDLYKLNYEIYGVEKAPGENEWSIIGITPFMKLDVDVITEWTGLMYGIAGKHSSLFDGWGTMISE
ncbi:MAG: ribonuclease E inhibitor RraB [bacterium]